MSQALTAGVRRKQRPRAAAQVEVVLTSMIAAACVWTVAVPIAGVSLTVTSGGGETRIGVVSVLIASGLAAVAGAASLRLGARWGSRGVRAWTVIAVGVLLLSLLGPLGATTAGGWAALTCLHGVVGGVVVFGLRNAARARPASPGTPGVA